MTRQVWLVNKGSKSEKVCILELKKHIEFAPGRPVQLPWDIAQRYVNHTIHLCSNPEKYFNSIPLNHLTIRDAGIGDLLLLEPCLRAMKKKGNRNVAIASRYPEVYFFNPYIDENLSMKSKEDLSQCKTDKYDAWDDLRNYSESCPTRATKHRTDCYNEIYNISISNENKEPRIYIDKSAKKMFKKKKGMRYIGINFDASHRFRRYEKGAEAIEYILQDNINNVVVILGSHSFVKYNQHKRIIDFQGRINIRQLIDIVIDLDYLIAVDSGVMHIGLATHTPTVGIFSIINPELRIGYYKGEKRIIFKKELKCIGCGSYHMAHCDKESRKNNVLFIPPCMNIDPKEMTDKMNLMQPNQNKRIFYSEDKKISEIKPININKKIDKKITMPIIVLNEEKNLPRFIELVMSHSAIGRTIAIDGGSTDKTIDLLEKAGADIYIHNYDKDYHDMQAMQRNYSCSFVPDGEKILIMDIDECFSKELSDWLYMFVESNINYALISRRTFEYYKDISDPNKRIKDYPDWQPRAFTWNRRFKWVGSPHHNVYNCPEPIKVQKDIVHFEREGKDRDALEKKWAEMQAKTRMVYA